MRLLARLSLVFAVTFSAVAQQPAAKPSFAQPAISPDAKEIAFASGGDIWTVPAAGGDARLLISDPAEESRPLYSPDGTRLAFNSTRTGANDIYVLTFATGRLQRITFSDSAANLDAWSHDGQWLYFTSSANDVAGQGDIFRVRASGGTPLEVSRERYMNEFEAAPSPDGQQIALVTKGISNSQWWRNGHAHIDETEIWTKPVAGQAGYKLLVPADSKHAWPMWSANGKSLLFMSDHSGSENIWQLDIAGGTPKQLTTFKSGRCLWPTLSADGSTIVFERHFAIYKLDLRSGRAAEVPVTLRGVPSAQGITHTSLASWSNLALSPDGRKIAVAAHGDIFAADAKQGGEPQRLTRTEAAESDPQWSPDSTQLLYLSERDGGDSLYLYDFDATRNPEGKEKPLTHGLDIDGSPQWSPDGKSIAYLRNRKELHVLSLAGMKDQTIARGEIDFFGGSALAWSPDSHWIVYLPSGTNGFSNLAVVPAAGGPSRPITFLANGQNASHIAWSPDGKYILFDTAQRAETPQLARVDLVPHVPSFREDQFTELFRKQSTPGAPDTPPSRRNSSPDAPTTPEPADPSTTPATPDAPTTPGAPSVPPHGTGGRSGTSASGPKKPVEPTKIVFEGIHERLTLLPLGDLPVRFPVISPDGKTLAFLAESAGQSNFYTYSLDELSREPASPRQLTSTPAGKSSIAFTPDSREIYFLEGGGGARGGAPTGAETGSGVRAISLETRTPRSIALSASIDIDFDLEKQVVFDEAWNTLNHRFVNADFNGANWLALRAEWQPYIAGARTGPELRRNISLLIGELNSSHSGISKPAFPAVRTGRLGLRFEREPFERDGSLIIREVVPLGPASLEGSIHPGDRLLAVDRTPITPGTNLDQLLEDRAGKRTVLTLSANGKTRDAILRPATLQTESGLLYRDWVAQRRAYVDRISGGKLGYVHIPAMGDSDLAQLYLDLDVQNQSKQGVVIDVRNNNGGYVNGRVIDVFARRNYLVMTPRDGSPSPSRQALGQRALGLPTVLVTNESTLSDGEDFTEGYRALSLGKVVGEPTAGWIIFTGAQRLIDGSSVRVPGEQIKDTRGQVMEMHPRPVDIPVDRSLGETEAGKDTQLDTAVATLLSSAR